MDFQTITRNEIENGFINSEMVEYEDRLAAKIGNGIVDKETINAYADLMACFD